MIFLKPNVQRLEREVEDLETRHSYLKGIVVGGIDSRDDIMRQLAKDSRPCLKTTMEELREKRTKLFSLQGGLEICSPDNNKAKKPESSMNLRELIEYAKWILKPQTAYRQTERFKY